ncbi:MAG: hypothetical protein CVU39_17675 [Chloroflexi bacterium HGW-Chloroflexi-10]|nr:MAG: hypothetical protein CVU39_17675 [Chloroflexi bacterium HGW-Chloroflexi-10]
MEEAMKNNLKLLVYLSLLGLIILVGCNSVSAATTTPEATDLPAIRNSNLVLADAKVIPVDTASLSFNNSGVVQEVLVTEGSPVKANAIIARLGGSERILAEIAAAELDVLSAEQERDDLLQKADLARAQARLNLANLEKELDKAIKQSASKQYKWGSQDQIDIAFANLVTAEDDVKNWEENFSYVDERDPSDPERAAVLSALAAARQRRDQAKANYNYLIGKPNELDINVADSNLEVAEQNVAQAKAELERLQNGPDPIKLAQVEARLKSAQARLDASRANLAELELTAPFNGQVVSNPLKAGELVNPGNPLVLVADLNTFQVETTDLTEINILGITSGDPVIVHFDALSEVEIPGTVLRVNQLGANQQGDITYTVLVSLSEQDPRLMWNMTATVEFTKK